MTETDSQDWALWEQVCRAYGLGELLAPPQPVSGGLQHRMWRADTRDGMFAIKFLHPRCAADADCRRRCAWGERVARLAAEAGLPAVAALDGPGGPLQRFGQAAVLCYRWEEGVTLPPAAAPPAQTGLIGELLGRLHMLGLSWEGAELPAPEWAAPRHWQDTVGGVQGRGLSLAPALASALPDLLLWNDATRRAAEHLGHGWVVSHRDLDQKNVLWRDAATPRLLDWEAAGPVHPALEVMGAALNWAGQSAGPPDEAAFRAFLDGYRGQASLDCDALRHAATAVLGKWLVWLNVCLGRALDSGPSEGQDSALGAAAHALTTLRALADATPERLSWCDTPPG